MQNEQLSHLLYNALQNQYPEQVSLVMDNNELVDIAPEFMGFVDVYEALAKLIPEHWDVVDLGCAYAAQAFYFRGHKAYHGVDVMEGHRFEFKNTMHFVHAISSFIDMFGNNFDLDNTFVICNAVPPWGADNAMLARQWAKNVFVMYPSPPPVPSNSDIVKLHANTHTQD